MSLDSVKNFAKVTVSTLYALGDTSIVLTTDHGARLPAPATDGAFNLVWWNSTDYSDPADDPNKEIVRCTARSIDTLTVTRAQETTSATNKNTAGKTYSMILSMTAKMVTDLGTVSINAQSDSYQLTIADIGAYIQMSKTSANNLTVPANATVAFPIGTIIAIEQTNTGQTTIVAAADVIIRYLDGLKFVGQYAVATVIKTATNTWTAYGSLEA